MSKETAQQRDTGIAIKHSGITVLKILALNLVALVAISILAILHLPGIRIILILSHILQILLLISLIVFVVRLLRAKTSEEYPSNTETPNRKKGHWVLWIMGILDVLSVFVLIPAVAVADLSEFGALGLLFMLLFGTPVVIMAAAVLPWFGPVHLKKTLGWARAIIIASMILTWLVFLLRAGFFA